MRQLARWICYILQFYYVHAKGTWCICIRYLDIIEYWMERIWWSRQIAFNMYFTCLVHDYCYLWWYVKVFFVTCLRDFILSESFCVIDVNILLSCHISEFRFNLTLEYWELLERNLLCSWCTDGWRNVIDCTDKIWVAAVIGGCLQSIIPGWKAKMSPCRFM